MKTINKQFEDHFINFMMNPLNDGTFTSQKLWEIEFNSGGHVNIQEDGKVWLSGDNGRIEMSELTLMNLEN